MTTDVSTGIERLDPAATAGSAGLKRGDVGVCIPTFGAYELFTQCMQSVLAHTPAEVAIVVADDASADPSIHTFLLELAESGALRHRLLYMRQPENVGFVKNVNSTFDALAPADVVVLNSDCIVPAGWLESLQVAADSDTRVATVSALTNNGTILSVPIRNTPLPNLPQDCTLDAAAAAVKQHSLLLYPEIPTAVGHCMYIKRAALDLVGNFDETFSPGYCEEVDFSQQCVRFGMKHVVADDLFVLHRGNGSFADEKQRTGHQKRNHDIITARYPYYDALVEEAENDDSSHLARAIGAAKRAFYGLSITVDGRCLGPFITGTQACTLELILALDDMEQAQLRVIVPSDLGDYAAALFAARPQIEVLKADEVTDDTPVSDIMHRPYQVSSRRDLKLLKQLGSRLVITHLDLIAYNNPSYFDNVNSWRTHRLLTELALAKSDHTVFISQHSRSEAVQSGLVTNERSTVVYPGTDHRLAESKPPPQRPAGLEAVGERPMLLCIGADFRHKNRLFAIKVLEKLRNDHDWNGVLVCAGGRVHNGSSTGAEAAYLASRPQLAPAVINVAAIDESEKAWLLANVSAVIYPTTYEGFGLVPFEAAEAGVPCLFAAQTSLAELFPPGAALITPWDVDETAIRAVELMADQELRDEHIQTLRVAGSSLTWKHGAEQLMGVYSQAVEAPVRENARLVGAQLRLVGRYRELGELLLYERENSLQMVPVKYHHPILSIVTRPWLRTFIFGPLALIYKFGYRLRRIPRGKSDLHASDDWHESSRF